MSDAETTNGNGRPALVCEACRIRHRKCDWDDEACRQCKNIGLECVRQPTYRFRYDALQKKLPKDFGPHELDRVRLTFYDETPGLLEFYHGWVPPMDDFIPAPAPPMDASPCDVVAIVGFTPYGDHVATISSNTSPITNTTFSPGNQHNAAQSPLTASEVRLIRNFSDNMALWSDNTDPLRTFELEAPRRALTEPLLKHAICAFSARHFYRHVPDRDAEAESLNHQSKCLELLIPALSAECGSGGINEVTLTAVALLRQNEEMDEDDNRFHLSGVNHILSSIPDFAASGGLAEAACWLCLRGNIYISLTTQTPLTIAPENFLNSTAIARDDDFSHCQRMILHLAFLLNRAFAADRSGELEVSEREIAEWDCLKPESYYPLLIIPRSRAAGRIFPEIWTLAPHHTIGLQYFHIAQIVLIIAKQHSPPPTNGGVRLYDRMTAERKRERQIRDHLLTIVGLAVSNPRAENTLFTASHCLSVWAGCLRSKEDREGALRFLADMGRRTGWMSSTLCAALRRGWREDSESG